MNAANEEAVGAFIDERICLTDIPRVIEAVMDKHSSKPLANLETVLETDRAARLFAISEIEKLSNKSTILAERMV